MIKALDILGHSPILLDILGLDILGLDILEWTLLNNQINIKHSIDGILLRSISNQQTRIRSTYLSKGIYSFSPDPTLSWGKTVWLTKSNFLG